MTGVRQRISNKDADALKALDFAVAKMNLEAVNERAYFKPSQIFNTYRQVVSGFKYTFVFKYAPTNCEKHEDLSMLKADDCIFGNATATAAAGKDDEMKSKNCKISVHDQPWITTSSNDRYKLTNMHCF